MTASQPIYRETPLQVSVDLIDPKLRDTRERWQDTTPGPEISSPDGVDMSMLLEEHHHLYGRPWCLGKYYFEYMQSRGLRCSDRVLDFGCGSGRLAVWLVDFLDRDRYFGIDSHYRSLNALARYEIPLRSLEAKRPRLLCDGSLNLGHFKVRFEWVTDLFVSYHMTQEERIRTYAAMRDVLSPGGRIITLLEPEIPADRLAGIGLELTHQEVQSCPLLSGQAGVISDNPWFEYSRIS